MPSLQNQAMEARKHLKAARDEALKKRSNGKKNGPRPRISRMERDIAVLWGLYHSWSDEKIGEYFYISRTAVIRARRELNDTHIFRTRILHRDVVGNKQVWRCEACSGRMVGTERKARLHVVDHFGISQSSIRNVGVMDEDLIL